jgi:hypothetical protein
MHRVFPLLVAFFLVACGGDDLPVDSPEAPGAQATATSAGGASGDAAVDPALVGFWTQAYRQYSPDGTPQVSETNVYWTLREDGSALDTKQSDQLSSGLLTADYNWTRSGDRLAFAYAPDGAEGPQWNVVRLEGDTMTVKAPGREEYRTFARGPAE